MSKNKDTAGKIEKAVILENAEKSLGHNIVNIARVPAGVPGQIFVPSSAIPTALAPAAPKGVPPVAKLAPPAVPAIPQSSQSTKA